MYFVQQKIDYWLAKKKSAKQLKKKLTNNEKQNI